MRPRGPQWLQKKDVKERLAEFTRIHSRQLYNEHSKYFNNVHWFACRSCHQKMRMVFNYWNPVLGWTMGPYLHSGSVRSEIVTPFCCHLHKIHQNSIIQISINDPCPCAILSPGSDETSRATSLKSQYQIQYVRVCVCVIQIKRTPARILASRKMIPK